MHMCRFCGKDLDATVTLPDDAVLTVMLADHGDRLNWEHGHWYTYHLICRHNGAVVYTGTGPLRGYQGCVRRAWRDAAEPLAQFLNSRYGTATAKRVVPQLRRMLFHLPAQAPVA